MPVTAAAYGQVSRFLFARQIDWLADDIRLMLTTAAYVPDQDSHTTLANVTGEVAGTGYTAGGAALTGKTVTYDAAANRLILAADDVAFPNSTITARRAVVYRAGGATPADRPLIAWIDFGADVSSSNGTFAVIFSAGGIVQVDVANVA